jgi:hypothetical protein
MYCLIHRVSILTLPGAHLTVAAQDLKRACCRCGIILLTFRTTVFGEDYLVDLLLASVAGAKGNPLSGKKC